MKSARKHTQSQKSIGLPVVLIETEKPSAVLNIREYLESNGCVVYVNHLVRDSLSYHIIVGSSMFVKNILDNPETNVTKHTKGIIITWVKDKDIYKQSKLQGYKYAVVDTYELSSDYIQKILKFLFTSKKRTLSLETHSHSDSAQAKTAHRSVDFSKLRIPHDRALNERDKKRVASFVDSAHKKRFSFSTKHIRKIEAPTFLKVLFIGTLFLFITPFVWVFFTLSCSSAVALISAKNIERGNVSTRTNTINIGLTCIQQAEHTTSELSDLLSYIVPGARFTFLQNYTTLVDHVLLVEKSIGQLAQDGSDVLTQIVREPGAVDTSSGEILLLLSSIQDELSFLDTTLGLIQTEIPHVFKNIAKYRLLSKVMNTDAIDITRLETYRSYVQSARDAVALYTHASGFDKPMHYLVLLQNSMELRPAGGFIGSVAHVIFQNGSLMQVDIKDVYELDGQLKGHVDPPPAIRDIIKQEHWYLRDSNWDKDFEESAKQASWFYQKEGGGDVDGVVALSTPFILGVLKAVGQMELSDFQETITAENFYGKAHYYTQEDFFPGSTQKKDFLGSLARNLLLTTPTLTKEQYRELFQEFATSLYAKDIMLYFHDSELLAQARAGGWTGTYDEALYCSEMDNSACITDHIYVSEANVGVNKANVFVTRDMVHDIAMKEDGKLEGSIQLVFSHSGQGADARDRYLSYIQIYMPRSVSVSSVAYNNQTLKTRSTSDFSGSLVPFQEQAYTKGGELVVPVVFALEVGETATLGVAYTRSTPGNIGDVGVYNVLYPKHPGVHDMNVTTYISYPSSWVAEAQFDAEHPFKTSVPELAKNNYLEYNTVLSHDTVHNISFRK